jgi:2-deoxy-D-gluconate 3-dehydrogenase
MDMFDLTGRVAVVTGGNGGIGRGIALGLGAAGAKVAVLGRNEGKNQLVLSELKALGYPSIAVSLDVTNRPGLEPALRKVESELGGIDVMVNNAGNVSLSGGVLNETAEDWDNVIETQLNAVFLLSKLAGQIHDEPQARKDYQHWQHVLVLWIWTYPVLQRGERRNCAVDQVDGH